MTSTQTAPAPLPATPTLIFRFGAALMRVAQLVGDRLVRDRSAANMARVLMAQARLISLSRGLRALLERIEAGTLPKPRIRRAAAPAAAAETEVIAACVVEAETPTTETTPLPRKFGWLVSDGRADNHHVVWGRDQVGNLLNSPEMLGKLAEAPLQAGRLVRPLCHMLGLATPEMFRLPPRPRAPRPSRAAMVAPTPRAMSVKWPRVASANWPKGCVFPGEAIPLRTRNRRRVRRNE